MSALHKLLPLLFGAALIGSAAHAQPSKPEGGVSRDLEKQFQALDRNGDGFVSREELAANQRPSGRFTEADKNADGKLDQAEFQALEANSSPDRSLGSVAPQESGSAGASAKPERSK